MVEGDTSQRLATAESPTYPEGLRSIRKNDVPRAPVPWSLRQMRFLLRLPFQLSSLLLFRKRGACTVHTAGPRSGKSHVDAVLESEPMSTASAGCITHRRKKKKRNGSPFRLPNSSSIDRRQLGRKCISQASSNP